MKTMREGIFAKHLLTDREMSELEQLAEQCNAYEKLLMRFDYNMLAFPSLPTDDLFLFYHEDQLAGCLLLDRYHSNTKEITGMVRPNLRRRGIFRQLLAAAREECLSRGIRRLLFICETTSASGQAFLKATGATREFAEHRMMLRQFQPRFQYDDRLLLREAYYNDLEKLALTMSADFDNSIEQARQHLSSAFERPNQHFYLATYGGEEVGCAEPVGTVRVEEMPSELGIYGFFVRPEYRRRGHGRQILEETVVIWRESSQKPIMLEVDANNFTALNLYHSLGFVTERTYEYHALTLN